MRPVRPLLCVVGVVVGCSSSSTPSSFDGAVPGDGASAAGDSGKVNVPGADGSTTVIPGDVMPYNGPLSVGNDPLDLQCVPVGGEGAMGVQLQNKGTQPLGPVTVRVAGPGGERLAVGMDGCSTKSLGPGQTCDLTIVFHPVMPGAITASLDVYAPPADLAHFPVTGSSRKSQPLQVQPDRYDFGIVKVGAMSAVTSFQVANPGDTPGKAPRVRLQFGDAFQIADDKCTGYMLDPKATCAVQVRFAPKAPGAVNDAVIFSSSSACDSDSLATLGGAGVP
jgi:hypothetical protein